MKNVYSKLNKVFESKVRLGVMSLLMVDDEVDFLTLRKTLQLKDGTLASHLTRLEKEKYIEVRKGFVGKKTRTTYLATTEGKKAFKEHLDALEEIIKGMNL